ncbi:MAG: hypothetical protein JOZ54_13960 [Acidobacteria bacterium]|nr:hypothetical protein [Acidobacteriota bacterium]
MKTVQLSELGALAEEIRKGEAIDIVDGEKVVASIAPYQADIKAHIDRLVAEGKAWRGTGTLPDDFFTRPLAKCDASVVEALLEDRHSRD